MVSESVRYLFYQPMDEKIKTCTLRFPAKKPPNMEKALFDCPIVLQYPFDKPIKSLYFCSFVVSILFARFHFKVIGKSLYQIIFHEIDHVTLSCKGFQVVYWPSFVLYLHKIVTVGLGTFCSVLPL